MRDIPPLSREDYTDPQCPFCTDAYKDTPPVRMVNCERVITKLEEYLGKNNYAQAERHLLYWLTEAVDGRDLRGQFTIRNELIGLYRKIGNKDASLENARAALALVDTLEIWDSPGAGTAYINTATAYKAFDMAEEALPLFEKAKELYEKHLAENDGRLGGLYNNMALALADLARYDEAMAYYEKALSVMRQVPNGELEQAVTYLNMAEALDARFGIEAAEQDVNVCLDRAEALLHTEHLPRDGYYAFVCEKCAPTFGYFGRFFTERELARSAEEIYARP